MNIFKNILLLHIMALPTLLLAQNYTYTTPKDNIKIILTIGTPTKNSDMLEKQLLTDPLDTNYKNITSSALTNKTCLTPDVSFLTTPDLMHNVLRDVFPEAVSIETTPSLDPRTCFSTMFAPVNTNVCGCPQAPPLQEIRITVATKQLFETYKKRLMLFHELFPKIAHTTLKLSEKRTGKDRQRLIVAMQKLIQTLRLQN